jgi:hypothetical protein
MVGMSVSSGKEDRCSHGMSARMRTREPAKPGAEDAVARPAPSAPESLSSTASVLALQRTHGNRQVARWARSLARSPTVTVELRVQPKPPKPPPAMDMATPENRKLAEEIDELDKLDDAALVKRRWEVALKATGPADDEQKRLLQTLRALEFVASRRRPRIAPMKPNWDPYVRGRRDWHRLNVRSEVEEGVRQTGSLKKALKPIPAIPENELDIESIKDEAMHFKKEFRAQARLTADRMLRGSLTGMVEVIRSYGLPVDSVKVAADRVIAGDSVETQAENVIKSAGRHEDVDADANVRHRLRLAQWVTQLKKLQAKVVEKRRLMSGTDLPMSGEGPKWEEYKKAKANNDLGKARRRLEIDWIKAERLHPILAAYRRGGPLEDINLGTLDTDAVDKQMKTVVTLLLEKIANIGKAQHLIKMGELSPLTMPAVVGLTSASMFIPEGSIRAGAVSDLVEEERDNRESKWVMIAALALAVVTLIPSGGASLLVPAAIGSIGLAAYSAVDLYERYDRQKALTNTALDRARSLSLDEPSLTGFVMDLVSIGLDAVALGKIFRQARHLRKLAMAGEETGDAARALNKMGEEHGLGNRNLGDEVLQTTRAEGAAAKTAVSKPKFNSVRKLKYKHRGDVWRAAHGALDNAQRQLPQDWVYLLNQLERSGRTNKRIRALLPKVMSGLQNPRLYADVLTEAWEIAMKADVSINRALWMMATAAGAKKKIPLLVIPRKVGFPESPVFFEQYAAKKGYLVDLPALYSDHGAMTHLVHDLVVDRALKAAGENLTSPEFRALLGKAEGMVLPGPNTQLKKVKMRTGDLVWRMTYDTFENDLPKPELVGDTLQKLFGLI